MAFPPMYDSRRMSVRAGLAPARSELPAYSQQRPLRRATLGAPLQPPREPTAHSFQLLTSAGQPWAALRLYSHAKSSKSLPSFHEKEKLNGSVDLSLDRGDSVSAICVRVLGRVFTDGGCNAFLNMTVPLFGKDVSSENRSPTPVELIGRHSFPFAIVLPRTLDIESKSGVVRTCPLPETFLERHLSVSVQYDLQVSISRGKLKTDTSIQTTFCYTPSSRPDPASRQRQYSYDRNLPLVGPEQDPEGWFTCDPIRARGKVAKTKADVSCLLSLAKPMCYTRGSPIPLTLSLYCENTAALNAIDVPGQIQVSLNRRVKYTKRSGSKEKEVIEKVGTASWWTKGSDNSGTTRVYDGEIKLAKDMRSSSDVGQLSVSYFVALHPFECLGMKAKGDPLAIVPVSIATTHAKGPRPISYAPPVYDGPVKDESRHDFYMPYLAGGNGFSVPI
ncbi:hypothetical protein CYLTODRAFT_459351 [Cylindrobasidium torrendii FP15055 ss-10]|uniref:Arrestin-like N-terminal domain-containing protein n=1 Tax=Cylindrobasidium torrendii FP15055 ss-10 TaxID=1314674 RepID=A0A0D7AXM3_9AGAR|nr:hypothetical protein CYLTODRAFT_459351 [Cylindrobasidium torrendii FP15055 ss-10]